MPRRIGHQFTGYVAAKPISMPICIMNQNAALSVGRYGAGNIPPMALSTASLT